MITFRANYISSEQIKIKSLNDEYAPEKASFIELNPKTLQDISAVEWMMGNWQGNHFTENIYDTFISPASGDTFFALTTQKKDFEKINPKQILGIALISPSEKDNEINIDFLETAPLYTYSKRNSTTQNKPFYKWIGSAMIDGILKKFNDKTVSLFATTKSIPFYRAKNFEKYTISGIFKHKPTKLL